VPVNRQEVRVENDRSYPSRPILGVGAIVFDQQKQLLLIQRGHDPGLGLWSVPGGAVLLGETPEQGVARELEEECGIQITVRGIARVVTRIFRDSCGKIAYHYVIIDYLADWTTGEPRAGGDAADLAWVPRNDLASDRLTDGLAEIVEPFWPE